MHEIETIQTKVEIWRQKSFYAVHAVASSTNVSHCGINCTAWEVCCGTDLSPVYAAPQNTKSESTKWISFLFGCSVQMEFGAGNLFTLSRLGKFARMERRRRHSGWKWCWINGINLSINGITDQFLQVVSSGWNIAAKVLMAWNGWYRKVTTMQNKQLYLLNLLWYS